MRAYFRDMLADFAVRHDERAARRFGATLVKDGHLQPDDVDAAVRDQ